MEVSFLWLTFILIVASSLLSMTRKKKKTKNFPPGPKGLPILGHLHMLGKNPHQDLYMIAKNHGAIMYMRFGFVPNIIVSTPEAAELFLKTHDLVFASRPPHQAAKYLSWDQKNLSFSSYGPYWRNMRKLCSLELLSMHKINSFQSMRREEVGLFVDSLKTSADDRVYVDISEKVLSLTAEMSFRMVFGKKYDDKEIDERGFKSKIREGFKLGGIPNLGDYFPFLGVLDLQGLTKRLKDLGKVYDDFFEKVIDDHVRRGDHGQTEDIVDTMLSIMERGEYKFRFDRRHVKAIMLTGHLQLRSGEAYTIDLEKERPQWRLLECGTGVGDQNAVVPPPRLDHVALTMPCGRNIVFGGSITGLHSPSQLFLLDPSEEKPTWRMLNVPGQLPKFAWIKSQTKNKKQTMSHLF